MYLARIFGGCELVERVDDYETDLVSNKVVRRPRKPRAWRFHQRGAAAFSQSPEGALASARAMLEENPFDVTFQPTRESA